MKRFSIAAAFALLVGGSAPAPVQSGGWTHSMTIHKATIPGIPGFLIPKGKQRAYKTCLAASDAARNPGALLVGQKMTCTPRRIAWTGGRIESLATCTDTRLGLPLSVSSTGTYTATSYTLRSTSTGMRRGKPVRIETTSTGTRTHGC